MEAQTTILTAEELQKFIGIKGFFGRFIAKSLLKLFRIDEANRIQNKYRDYTGPEFSARVLEECGVSWEIPQEQQFKSINSSVLSFLHSLALTTIHDHRKNHSLD